MYTSCTPLVPPMFAGIVRHDVQPPVLPTAKLPITGDVAESSRTSTSPLTPPPAPEATLATNCFAGAAAPKSTFAYLSQSPLPRSVTADEPIVAPFDVDAASASMVP